MFFTILSCFISTVQAAEFTPVTFLADQQKVYQAFKSRTQGLAEYVTLEINHNLLKDGQYYLTGTADQNHEPVT